MRKTVNWSVAIMTGFYLAVVSESWGLGSMVDEVLRVNHDGGERASWLASWTPSLLDAKGLAVPMPYLTPTWLVACGFLSHRQAPPPL
jgi:hypothetical protein